MNIELEEVVVMDVSDDALELAAGDAQGGRMTVMDWLCLDRARLLLAIADR
jgi:hypothetical protein